MTLREFDKTFNKAGCSYKLVDAKQTGYMTTENVIFEGDRNATVKLYGDCNVDGIRAAGKNKIMAYLK